jgi:MFS family permease
MGAALFVTTVTSFLTPLMGSALNLALPAIGREFSLDAVTLGWIPTAYLLAAAIFLIPFGRLGDIHGRKRIYASGVVLHTVSSLLCGLAPSAAGLIGLRVAQGLGASMVFSTAMAILTSATPADMRGRVIGINTASVYAGLTCGPVVGGFLTQHYGWRSVFFLNVPLGIIILVAALVVMGLGFALFSAPNTNAIMSSVGKKTYGVASATLSTMRLTGQMLSMGLTMMIFALRIGRVEIEPPRYPAFVGAARIVFAVFAVFCFAGIFASLVRGKVRPKAAEKLQGAGAPSP